MIPSKMLWIDKRSDKDGPIVLQTAHSGCNSEKSTEHTRATGRILIYGRGSLEM